jgi:hypothetical protein
MTSRNIKTKASSGYPSISAIGLRARKMVRYLIVVVSTQLSASSIISCTIGNAVTFADLFCVGAVRNTKLADLTAAISSS